MADNSPPIPKADKQAHPRDPGMNVRAPKSPYSRRSHDGLSPKVLDRTLSILRFLHEGAGDASYSLQGLIDWLDQESAF